MSSIKVLLKVDKLNKVGEAPLYLRLIKDRKAKFVSLSISVNPKDWNGDTMRVKKSHPNSQRINNFIAQKIAEAEGIALEMETSSKYVSPKKIKEAIVGKTSESFLKYFENYVSFLLKSGKMATHRTAEVTITKLKRYLKGKDLAFDELTHIFLKNYESHLKDDLGNSINTVRNNLEVIRRLCGKTGQVDHPTMEQADQFQRSKLTTQSRTKLTT